MTVDLTGRVALVTGGSRGIGRAVALSLGAAGAAVAVNYREQEAAARMVVDAIADAGRSAMAIAADVADSRAVTHMVAETEAALGPIDILVNNAGVNHFGRFAAMTAAEIDGLLATNVMAPMKLVHAALPDMIARRQGKIVNIGSVFGGIGFAGFAAYSAGKFALRGFSEALRRELHGSGVSVVYVAPRYTRTALNVGAVERMATALALRMDDPAAVALRIARAIREDAAECTIGLPERFFVRLNALFPRLVDSGLTKTTARMLSFVSDPARSA